jgi:endonuclease/exonuclease/phosphatase family metal-dependent hydrolase
MKGERIVPLDATKRLVFASYNVHAWIGMDGVASLERVLRVVREINADVIGLQEVSLPRGDSLPISREIIEATTGMHAAFGPTMLRQDADFGNVLLSRYPFEAVRRHDISFRAREPRGIVDATIRIHGRTVRVCTTHFGLRAVERNAQARRLAQALFRAPTPSLLVGMGDLNDWVPWSPFIRPLLERFTVKFSCEYEHHAIYATDFTRP